MALQTVFTIGAGRKDSGTLLVEYGPDHCCYAFLNTGAKTFELVRYFSFEEQEAEQQLAAILSGIEEENFEKIYICSSYSQALLIPHNYQGRERQLLDAVYDTADQQYFTAGVAEWQMTAAFYLPSVIAERLSSRYPGAVFLHAYVPALKIYNGFVAPDQLDIYFTPRHFRVIVKKDNSVQLAQTYSYKTPLDVVYYLLKICYEFGLEQKEVFLILSGLIEEDSALYAELHNYFLNLHFAQAATYTLPEHEHPHYYFSSLYNLAACVS